MSNLKDWLARDVLIVGKLEASDEVYVPGCGYYQPEQGTHVILCEGAEPVREFSGEVWLLMATDVETGREEVLGVYATKAAAEAAISENRCGFALHNVQRWEVDA